MHQRLARNMTFGIAAALLVAAAVLLACAAAVSVGRSRGTGASPGKTAGFDGTESVVLDGEYRNFSLGFSVRMPAGGRVAEERHDEHNAFSRITGDRVDMLISRRDGVGIDLSNFHYMDVPSSGDTTMGGEPAHVHRLPKGYCDGPGCSEPFIAAVTMHERWLYVIRFYGDGEWQPAEREALASFLFIKEQPR